VGVTLEPITKANYLQCLRLKVGAGQEGWVAPNAVSLVQAVYEEGAIPRAIYDGETMVGFVMGQHIPAEPMPYIWRLMVDTFYQGKGYGRAGLEQMVAHLRELTNCKSIAISYMPENEPARQLYASMGFVETGEMDGDEVIAQLDFKDDAESPAP
jgi:diamine N-acetyltransferase